MSVAVGTGSPSSRRERGIKLQLHRIAKPAADSYTRGDNHHLQEEKNQLEVDLLGEGELFLDLVHDRCCQSWYQYV